MNVDAIRKELEKYESQREKVLRLNELGKYDVIYYGYDNIVVFIKSTSIYFYTKDYDRHRKCLLCLTHFLKSEYVANTSIISNIKNRNEIRYCICERCDRYKRRLCATCLRELTECHTITKQKITFWLCVSTIPKDIRRLITNLFFY
jgi:hypothetical protein